MTVMFNECRHERAPKQKSSLSGETKESRGFSFIRLLNNYHLEHTADLGTIQAQNTAC